MLNRFNRFKMLAFSLLLVFAGFIFNVSPANAVADPNASANKQIESLVKSLDFDLKTVLFDDGFEGAYNVKDSGAKNTYTGEAYVGQDLKINFYIRQRSMSNINEQRKKNGYKPHTKVTKKSSNLVLQLTAKNGAKVIKSLKTTSANKNDNVISYKVDKNVTDIEVKVSGTISFETGTGTCTRRYDEHPKLLKIKIKDKKALANAKLAGASTSKTSGGSDGGMSTTTMVGGAAALGALGWGALKFFGGGAGAAAGGASGGAAGAAAPNNPAYKKDGEDLIYTDPATGAQSIYSQDADGNWVNRETGGVLDVGRVDDVTAQRAKDAAWQQEAMDDMVKKDKQRALDEISEAAKAKENAAQEAYKEKLKEKYGVTEGSEEALKEKIAAEQGKESQRASEWLARANTMDKTVGVMNFIQTAADTGISITSKFVPGVGVPIATVYTITKNVTGGMMGGLVEASKLGATNSGNVLQKVGKVAVGTSQGILNAGIDVAQSFTSGKWLALSNIGGEAVKSTLEAGLNGENKTKAFVSGLSKGAIKQGLGMLTDKLAANQKTSVLNSSRAELKDAWKAAREKQEQLINKCAKNLLESQKAAQSKALADGVLYKGNPAEVAQKMRNGLMKMNAQSFFAQAEALDPATVAERASNVVKSVGDVAQGANELAFNEEIGFTAKRWK